MERPRHPFRLVAAGAILVTGAFIGLRPDQHIMSADDWFQREHVLSSYPFTFDAAEYLGKIPFFNRQTTNNGGGYSNDDVWGRWVEVFARQRTGFIADEAALHEMSEIYFRRLTDLDPTFPDKFISAVNIVVKEDKPLGFYQTLKKGDGTSWEGIPQKSFEDKMEWWGSINSFQMGGTKEPIPDLLKPYIGYEFIIPEYLDMTLPAKEIPTPLPVDHIK